MVKRKTQNQMKLGIMSNSGGVGKTTIAAHLAYSLAKKGYKTLVIELDQQDSFRLSTGLGIADPERSAAKIFQPDFKGDYPIVQIWQDHTENAFLIQGGAALRETPRAIEGYKRRYYILQDRLKKFPLDFDVILIDTPGGLEPFGTVILPAITHLIVVVEPDFKATTSGGLFLEWFYSNAIDLDLDPPPQILGFLPNTRQPEIAAHAKILDKENPNALPAILQEHETRCFPQIKFSAEFVNASDPSVGLPVFVYRPKAPALKGFTPVIQAIEECL
ncbi:ParA family protein [Leptolyngbya sp. AN03gr2]|uniref:ParA family protein n=2 Tax=unclassified Leptolyngbya TaxID=2650499 RepID=UPI003D311CEB